MSKPTSVIDWSVMMGANYNAILDEEWDTVDLDGVVKHLIADTYCTGFDGAAYRLYEIPQPKNRPGMRATRRSDLIRADQLDAVERAWNDEQRRLRAEAARLSAQTRRQARYEAQARQARALAKWAWVRKFYKTRRLYWSSNEDRIQRVRALHDTMNRMAHAWNRHCAGRQDTEQFGYHFTIKKLLLQRIDVDMFRFGQTLKQVDQLYAEVTD